MLKMLLPYGFGWFHCMCILQCNNWYFFRKLAIIVGISNSQDNCFSEYTNNLTQNFMLWFRLRAPLNISFFTLLSFSVGRNIRKNSLKFFNIVGSFLLIFIFFALILFAYIIYTNWVLQAFPPISQFCIYNYQ
jgi:hypothetical protein